MLLKQIIDKLKSNNASIFGILVPMHYFLLIVFIGIVLYGLISWVNRDKWDTLVHEQYGFAIDYPANWVHNTYGESGSKNLHDMKAQAYTNPWSFLITTPKALQVYRAPIKDITLSQAAQWDWDISTKRNGTVSDLKETQIGSDNYPALSRTIQHSYNSQMYVQYFVVHNESAYLLEFFLGNKNDMEEATPIFSQMLSSFHINE